jgi:hypothetical protein
MSFYVLDSLVAQRLHRIELHGRSFHQHSRRESQLAEHTPELALLCRDAIFHDASIEQVHRAIGMLGKTCIMGNHANGCTTGV